MDTKTLIQLLNFYQTLIQDAEIQFIFYEKFPTHPDDIGKTKQQVLAFRERELREVHNASDPEALRKAILRNIEEVKKFYDFNDSDQIFTFQEINLVFQLLPDSMPRDYRLNYSMEQISRFENYPSLEHKRYFNGGDQNIIIMNTKQKFSGVLPCQFATDDRIGWLTKDIADIETDSWVTQFPLQLPPSNYIDETKVNVEISAIDGKDVFIITHFPFEEVMAKIYVHMAEFPKVFREKFYYQSPSPNANKEGYWLRAVIEYDNFVAVEELGIIVPKVYKVEEYRSSDGFLRRITKIIIQEMAFNQGMPANYFDWDEAELIDDEGMHKYIEDNVGDDIK